MALAALDVHHSANAAGIVLKLWVIQTKGVFLLCKVFHRLSHPYLKSSPVRHPPHFDKKEKRPARAYFTLAERLCSGNYYYTER